MKKLLSILASLGLAATAASSVVACGDNGSNNNGNNDNGDMQWANDWESELNIEKQGENTIVDESGKAKGSLNLYVTNSLGNDAATSEKIINNCIQVYKIEKEEYGNISQEKILNPGDDTYKVIFNSRTIDPNNVGQDIIRFDVEFSLGKQDDFKIENKYRLKLFNGSVDDFKNDNFSNFSILSFSQNSNVDTDGAGVFSLTLNAWWDNDEDRDKYFKVQNLKINKNSDGTVNVNFSFLGNDKSNNEFEIGKEKGWPDAGTYAPVNPKTYTGGISKNGEKFDANFKFSWENWEHSGINTKTLSDNETFAIVTKDVNNDTHCVRTIKISDADAKEVNKENEYFRITKLDKELSPASLNYKMILDYGAFVDLSDYGSYGSKLTVLCGDKDISNWFTLGELENNTLSFILNNKKAGWYDTGIVWNNFISEIGKYNDGDNTPKLSFNVSLKYSGYGKGESLVSNTFSVDLNKGLFVSSVENKKNKEIVQVGGHYTTGIYLHRSLVVKQNDISELNDDITITGGNHCVVRDIETIAKYGNGYALVSADIYPYGLGRFGTSEVAYLQYTEGGMFDPGKQTYQICELKLGEFWPAGFADSSLTVEGYDESKGITIDSGTREAKIGTLKYGNNIDTSNITFEVMSKSYNGQPVAVDGKSTGIDVNLESNVLTIKLNSSFDGRCIRPFDFDSKDDNMVNKYGDYRLQIKIHVGLKLTDEGVNSKTVNVDKIQFTPDKEDVAYVDSEAAGNNKFIYKSAASGAMKPAAWQDLSAELKFSDMGSNINWSSFKNPSHDISIVSSHEADGGTNDSYVWKAIREVFTVTFDADNKKMIMNWNGSKIDSDTLAVIGSSVGKGSYFDFKVKLLTKTGNKACVNDTNIFRVYFVPDQI